MENKTNTYTTEQLLNENLKIGEGESNKEVRERMLSFLKTILETYPEKRIAIVSHGAAIKFLLQQWCYYDYEENALLFNSEKICSAKLASPSILKCVFTQNDLISIEEIKLENNN